MRVLLKRHAQRIDEKAVRYRVQAQTLFPASRVKATQVTALLIRTQSS
jgi:hypothetical protein